MTGSRPGVGGRWERVLLAAIADGEVGVAAALDRALGREATRAELVAGHRAARGLVAAGKAVAGRKRGRDVRGREMVMATLAPVGVEVSQQKSQRAIARELQAQGMKTSPSTVCRRFKRLRRDWLELLPPP